MADTREAIVPSATREAHMVSITTLAMLVVMACCAYQTLKNVKENRIGWAIVWTLTLFVALFAFGRIV